MKEEIPQHNNREEEYIVERFPIDKNGITESKFINKETGITEKYIFGLPDGQRIEAILSSKTGAVKQIFQYDRDGNIIEFIDKEAIDKINRELTETIKQAEKQEIDRLLVQLMFEQLEIQRRLREGDTEEPSH